MDSNFHSRILLSLIFCFVSFLGQSQSVHFPKGHQAYHYFDRMDIKSGLSNDIHSSIKQLDRKAVSQFSARVDSLEGTSLVDQANLDYIHADNLEWFSDHAEHASQLENTTRKGLLKSIYATPANFISMRTKDLDLFINPIINFKLGNEQNAPNPVFQNTRGIELRGQVDGKVYFYTSLFENQARFYNYIERRIEKDKTIPSHGFYKTYDSQVLESFQGWDFANAEAYFGFPISKHIGFELGHSNHFIGNGYRSLLLNNYANNFFYLKLQAHVWKIHYQSIFAELATVSANSTPNSVLLSKKYMANHYLSYKPHRNFEIGFFETIVFSRTDHFEFQYLNPVILYRTAEYFLNSPDNVLIGLNGKWNLFNRISLYGQLILDEFKLSELTAGEGWWGNKYGIQMGMKYIDVAGVNNLDAQFELNYVRPFTYSHRDSLETFPEFTAANYSHHSQELAHPLGANFVELILNVNYQPTHKLLLQGKIMYAKRGSNLADENVGSDILLVSGTRNGDFGFGLDSGDQTDIQTFALDASYQFRHNYFIDLHLLMRKMEYDVQNFDLETNYIGGGLRINMSNFKIDY